MKGATRQTPVPENRSLSEVFASVFGSTRVQPDVSLAPMTTFKTGGAADWFLETDDGQDVSRALATCQQLGLPVTVMGGGSNVLVGGRGVRGLVVRMRHGRVALVRPGVVRADAGVSLNGLVRWTVTHGLSGLERWAGTPGTVGGAIHGNAHFRGVLIGDQVVSVDVAGEDGVRWRAGVDDMQFGYDRSRLQQSGEVALSAEFAVTKSAPVVLREAARESLAYRKRTQPLAARSAGCIFQNPDPQIATLPPDTPPSAGALIDRAGLKGQAVGEAQVSDVHGNFIVSDGASPKEIRELVDTCRAVVQERFGITLVEEIVYLGEF
jgi:UDP-N-acetylmuramate dehydrogenase